VDVVGLDASSDDFDRAHFEGHEALLALGKPFGFNEFGPSRLGDLAGDRNSNIPLPLRVSRLNMNEWFPWCGGRGAPDCA